MALYFGAVFWWLLTTALATTPDPETLRHEAALIDVRRANSAQRLAQLVDQLPTAGDWVDDYHRRLTASPLPPGERAFLLHALQPHPPSQCAPRRRMPLSAQIDRVRLCAHSPEAVDALLETFVRSRMGDLSEDPDLFERALRGAIQLRPDGAALKPLPDHLAPLLRQRLVDRWQEPLARARVSLSTPARDAELVAHLDDHLQQQWDQHGERLLAVMQTEQGSHLETILSAVERSLAQHWADASHPALARLGAEITAQLGPPPEDAQALPVLAPGQWPGTAPVPPQEPASAAWHHHTGRAGSRHGILLSGVFLFAVATMVGVRLPRARAVASFGLGVGLLLLVEGLLRAGGVSPAAQTRPLFSFTDWQFTVFTEDTSGDLLSTEGGWIRQQTISRTRPAFRAVTLGASSAHGSNHLAEEAFSALLETRLRQAHPDQSIEVLNLGVGGTTSNGVLHVGQAALALGADLLLIYYGHNEVAQFTALPLYNQTHPDRLRWRVRLGHSRLYSVLARLLKPGTAAMVPVDNPSEAPPPPSPADLRTLKSLAVENYRYNLDQLLSNAADEGCAVIMMNVATNYRFVDLQPLAIDDPETLGIADAALGRGDPGAALTEAQAVLARAQPGSAVHIQASVMVADLMAAAGDGVAARDVVQQAIDASARPGVVTSDIRTAIGSLAAQHAVPLLDVDRLFYARSPDGLSAPGLFWDDLHPSRWGHTLIADALYPEVNAIATSTMDRAE